MQKITVTIYLKSGQSFDVEFESITKNVSPIDGRTLGLTWKNFGTSNALFDIDMNDVSAIVQKKLEVIEDGDLVCVL